MHLPQQGLNESVWDKGPARNIVCNGPVSEMNLFASTVTEQITNSFRIRPKLDLKNTENPWSPAIISEHQPSCPFPPLIWLMHQNFIHHLTKISDTEAEDQQNLVIPPLQVDNIV